MPVTAKVKLQNLDNVIVQKFSDLPVLYNGMEQMIGIYLEIFKGMKNEREAKEWFTGKVASGRISQYFVARLKSSDDWHGLPLRDETLAYILWTEHGGFRPAAYVELEQVATKEEYQKNGIGSMLITKSFAYVKQSIEKRGAWLATLKVTTGEQNVRAQKMYRKILGVEIERRVPSPYHPGEWEVEMFARFTKP